MNQVTSQNFKKDKGLEETLYLFFSKKNKELLISGLEEARSGKTFQKELIEDYKTAKEIVKKGNPKNFYNL